ncbi:hypothetical protein LY90DRAFT_513966 [Neocallimastix californiae]|uniref:Uncharacterized protein n=1 Tax=Neocallimastix californiae TaxID=1754190 RepID=A0A1Y2ATX9_9FUNG|nr:hypothetical protein LY90DRAFT_513966 [Neocallimastix californiae]|eukprot:ORY26002.1 hypothetical protein LY90DRAFT_513966 [Neocallimastix californiae]
MGSINISEVDIANLSGCQDSTYPLNSNNRSSVTLTQINNTNNANSNPNGYDLNKIQDNVNIDSNFFKEHISQIIKPTNNCKNLLYSIIACSVISYVLFIISLSLPKWQPEYSFFQLKKNIFSVGVDIVYMIFVMIFTIIDFIFLLVLLRLNCFYKKTYYVILIFFSILVLLKIIFESVYLIRVNYDLLGSSFWLFTASIILDLLSLLLYVGLIKIFENEIKSLCLSKQLEDFKKYGFDSGIVDSLTLVGSTGSQSQIQLSSNVNRSIKEKSILNYQNQRISIASLSNQSLLNNGMVDSINTNTECIAMTNIQNNHTPAPYSANSNYSNINSNSGHNGFPSLKLNPNPKRFSNMSNLTTPNSNANNNSNSNIVKISPIENIKNTNPKDTNTVEVSPIESKNNTNTKDSDLVKVLPIENKNNVNIKDTNIVKVLPVKSKNNTNTKDTNIAKDSPVKNKNNSNTKDKSTVKDSPVKSKNNTNENITNENYSPSQNLEKSTIENKIENKNINNNDSINESQNKNISHSQNQSQIIDHPKNNRSGCNLNKNNSLKLSDTMKPIYSYEVESSRNTEPMVEYSSMNMVKQNNNIATNSNSLSTYSKPKSQLSLQQYPKLQKLSNQKRPQSYQFGSHFYDKNSFLPYTASLNSKKSPTTIDDYIPLPHYSNSPSSSQMAMKSQRDSLLNQIFGTNNDNHNIDNHSYISMNALPDKGRKETYQSFDQLTPLEDHHQQRLLMAEPVETASLTKLPRDIPNDISNDIVNEMQNESLSQTLYHSNIDSYDHSQSFHRSNSNSNSNTNSNTNSNSHMSDSIFETLSYSKGNTNSDQEYPNQILLDKDMTDDSPSLHDSSIYNKNKSKSINQYSVKSLQLKTNVPLSNHLDPDINEHINSITVNKYAKEEKVELPKETNFNILASSSSSITSNYDSKEKEFTTKEPIYINNNSYYEKMPFYEKVEEYKGELEGKDSVVSSLSISSSSSSSSLNTSDSSLKAHYKMYGVDRKRMNSPPKLNKKVSSHTSKNSRLQQQEDCDLNYERELDDYDNQKPPVTVVTIPPLSPFELPAIAIPFNQPDPREVISPIVTTQATLTTKPTIEEDEFFSPDYYPRHSQPYPSSHSQSSSQHNSIPQHYSSSSSKLNDNPLWPSSEMSYTSQLIQQRQKNNMTKQSIRSMASNNSSIHKKNKAFVDNIGSGFNNTGRISYT